MPRKKNDHYFELKLSLRRKNKKRKATTGTQQADQGNDLFWAIIGIGIGVFVYAFIMFQFETTIAAIPFFAGLMTLGGFETYDQTVILSTLIFLIGGIIVSFMVFDN